MHGVSRQFLIVMVKNDSTVGYRQQGDAIDFGTVQPHSIVSPVGDDAKLMISGGKCFIMKNAGVRVNIGRTDIDIWHVKVVLAFVFGGFHR